MEVRELGGESSCSSRNDGRFDRVAAAEWMDAAAAPRMDHPVTSAARWAASIEGGTIRAVDVRTAAGRQAAREAMSRKLPIVLRNAATALTPGVHEELQSLDQIGLHLAGESVHVLHAPGQPAAKATFARYANAARQHTAGAARTRLPNGSPATQRSHLTWSTL